MEVDHVAVFVDDLEDTSLAAALGGWAGPMRSIDGQPAISADGLGKIFGRTRRLRTTADAALSVWVEDATPDTPIRPVPGNAWHHIAVWCDDLGDTVAALEQGGYSVELRGIGPQGELAIFAYMTAPRGPRIELSEARRRDQMRAHIRSEVGEATGDRPPLLPREVATVVEDAAALETLRTCWQKAFGTQWRDPVDTRVAVATPAGERELAMRVVKSFGDPCVAIIAPDAASRSLLTPVASPGWHHVGLASTDLAGDVEAFQALGYELEFADASDDGRPRSFAMLAAPEGTRIKLTAA